MDKYRFIFKIVLGVLITLLINTVLILGIFYHETSIIATMSAADAAIAGFIFAHKNNSVPKPPVK